MASALRVALLLVSLAAIIALIAASLRSQIAVHVAAVGERSLAVRADLRDSLESLESSSLLVSPFVAPSPAASRGAANTSSQFDQYVLVSAKALPPRTPASEPFRTAFAPACEDDSASTDSSVEVSLVRLGKKTFQGSDRAARQAFCDPYRYTVLKTDPPVHMCVWPEGQDVYISNRIADGGFWDAEIIHHAGKLMRNKTRGFAIDAGANVGQFALFMAALGHDVYAFEPLPQHTEMIQRSIAMNPGFSERLTVFRNGLGERFYSTQVTVDSMSNRGGAHLRKILALDAEVNVITLDSLLQTVKAEQGDRELLVLKVDIEGSEVRFLRGAPEFLTTYPPRSINMEVTASHGNQNAWSRHGCDVAETMRALLATGYAISTPEMGVLEESKLKNYVSRISMVNTADIVANRVN